MKNNHTLSRLLDRISPEPNSGCWLWDGGSYHPQGYGRLWLRAGDVPGFREGSANAHRLSYALHKGPIPDRMFVCHKCDVPACINPDHLFLGTPADNSQDAARKGRMASGDRNGARRPEVMIKRRGELNGNSKLLPETVLAIYHSRGYLRDVAQQYGVSQALVWNIRNHRTWTHITRPEAA